MIPQQVSFLKEASAIVTRLSRNFGISLETIPGKAPTHDNFSNPVTPMACEFYQLIFLTLQASLT